MLRIAMVVANAVIIIHLVLILNLNLEYTRSKIHTQGQRLIHFKKAKSVLIYPVN